MLPPMHFFVAQLRALFPAVLLLAVPAGGQAQVHYWQNFVGKPGVAGHADGAAQDALFYTPSAVAAGSDGTLYVADTFNHVIRKISTTGVVSTLAGAVGRYGYTDGSSADARFSQPSGVAVDAAGNVFVSDYANFTIRKITPAGVVSTLAGTAGEDGSANGKGSAARFNAPRSIAVDRLGWLYVIDILSRTIRKISPAGVVSTLAGRFGVEGSADGVGRAATFSTPTGITVDQARNVWVTDGSAIRKITPAGRVTTLFGYLQVGAASTKALFLYAAGITADGAGNLWVTDILANTLHKISPQRLVTTVAGKRWQQGDPDHPDAKDGTGAAAQFGNPSGCAVAPNGMVYLADSEHHLIRQVSPAGVVTTYAGSPSRGSADGTGRMAKFRTPTKAAVDADGNLYVADTENHTIRKVTPAGVMTTLAGLAETSGSTDGTGEEARFNTPSGIAVDATGNVYVSDTGNYTVRLITPQGVVSTLAGLAGTPGTAEGTRSAARFQGLRGMTMDAQGNLYVCDNQRIRKVTPAGVVSTLAGSSTQSGTADGQGTVARFNTPSGLACDAAGNLYVADAGNNAIRKVTSAGQVTNYAGVKGLSGSSTDGPALSARFDEPTDVAMSTDGTAFVVDRAGNTVRRITLGGQLETIGGRKSVADYLDGREGEARFNRPTGITITSTGLLYVVDQGNNRISKGQIIYPPTVALTAVTNLTATSATLNGTVNPHGLATTAVFEYKLEEALGPSTSWTQATQVPVTLSPADGDGPQAVSVDIRGLTIGMTYHYRLSATNSDGGSTTVLGTLETKGVLDAHFATPDSVPQTTPHSINTLYLSSSSLGSVTFGFPPQMSAVYTLISNQGAFTNGTFQGLPEGALVTGTHGRDTFHFVISYRTPSGRDLRYREVTLTRVPGPGQVMQYEWLTYAGAAGQMGAVNGTAQAARFNAPFDVCADRTGQVYVTDRGNHAVRKISTEGQVTTFAGSLRRSGSANGIGSAARFNLPTDITIKGPGTLQTSDEQGWPFVSDWGNHTVRKVSPQGMVFTIAGVAGKPGAVDGKNAATRLHWPSGLAHDARSTLFMADSYNGLLRTIIGGFISGNQFHSDRIVTTVAGQAGLLGDTEGTGSSARFRYPAGMASDMFNNRIYLADFGNHTIRSFTTPSPFLPTAPLTTALVAGTSGISGSTDGPAATARFNYPRDVAFHQGSVYVADYRNHTIRVISPQGMVSTIGGVALQPGTAEGVGTQARFHYPSGLGFSFDGVLYVADSGNHRICAGVPGLLPFVTLNGVADQGSGSVLLAGTVNANGLITTAQFEYGPTTAYGSTATATPAPVNDTTAHAVGAALTGLTPGTLYQYRLTATNVDGSNTTVAGTFTAP